MPFYPELVEAEYAKIEIDGCIHTVETSTGFYDDAMEKLEEEYGEYEPEIVGYTLYIQTEDILKQPVRFAKLIDVMDRPDFPLQVEYQSARRLMIEMRERAQLNPKKLVEYI